MQELKEMFDKEKLENLISHFMEQDNSDDTLAKNYDEKLSQSYDKLYEELEGMYEQADREDNRLFDVITDFAREHDNTYFEIGVILGAKLCKNMERGYKKCFKSSIENILKYGYDFSMTDEDKKLLTDLFLARADYSIEKALQEDKDYQDISYKSTQTIKELDKLGLSKKEWVLIDRALSSSNDRGAEYGRVTYCQGFIDAMKLL